MATTGRPPEDVGLAALMTGSPETRPHMSAAAEAAFLLGLAALLTAPFSALLAATLVLAAAALVCAFVGLISTRGPHTAGSALCTVGLFTGLGAATLVALRYLGLDVAFGDELGPQLWDQLQRWNTRLPQPR